MTTQVEDETGMANRNAVIVKTEVIVNDSEQDVAERIASRSVQYALSEALEVGVGGEIEDVTVVSSEAGELK